MKNTLIAGLLPFLLFFVCSCPKSEGAVPLVLYAQNIEALDRQSLKREVSSVQKQDTLFYRFTPSQRISLLEQGKKNGAAFQVVLSYKAQDANATGLDELSFGFLSAEDIAENTYYAAPKHNPKAVFLPQKNAGAVTLSLCIDTKSDESIPHGFFISGTRPFSFDAVNASSAFLGYNESPALTSPVYAFSALGGTAQSGSFDFSGAGEFFSAKGDLAPKIELYLAPVKNSEGIGTVSSQRAVFLSYGKEKLTIRRTPSQNTVTLPTASFKEPFAQFTVIEGHSDVLGAILSATDVSSAEGLNPISSDLGMIFNWPKENWRQKDFEFFRWEAFPKVLIFDFANYSVQNLFFTRLAYFVEKTGYIGTLVSDSFIQTHHGYNAHDYSAESLAKFFTKAQESGFRLNQNEHLLCSILCANGIISKATDGTYRAGEGAVISFSRESEGALRMQLMAHESWHGIYFTTPEFRAYVRGLYEHFNPESMRFLKNYWAAYPSLQYDTTNEYLMQNEFMAYLLQQSASTAGEYFATRAGWQTVMNMVPSACSYVRNTLGKDFEQASRELEQYTFDHWGLASGRTYLISR